MNLQGIVGKKLYQSSGFLEDGTRVPLTAVATKGNFITQIKTTDKEGYNSLQLGFGAKKKPQKREINHTKKAGIEHTPRFLREFRSEDIAEAELGKEVLVKDVLKPGDIVDATGVSKGKGYAGVVKRHHFKGGPRTHGQSDRERAPGSIGQTTTPGRVYKGKRMAGRMGHQTATSKNLEVIGITDDGVVLIKGLVPGSVNSIITVRKTGENKKFVPLFKEIKEETKEENQPQEEVSTEATPAQPEEAIAPATDAPADEPTTQDVLQNNSIAIVSEEAKTEEAQGEVKETSSAETKEVKENAS
jgi:large subunit ribosomal protein L3